MYLDELCKHYHQTKLTILEVISNRIIDQYPELEEKIQIKRNRLEIDSDSWGVM